MILCSKYNNKEHYESINCVSNAWIAEPQIKDSRQFKLNSNLGFVSWS